MPPKLNKDKPKPAKSMDKVTKFPTFAEVPCKSSEELANALRRASAAFFNGVSLISDELYDVIHDELERRDPDNPVFGEVGAIVIEGREKAELPYWMGSLDKFKDAASIGRFLSRAGTPAPASAPVPSFIVTDKLDGISGLIHYRNGKLSLYTRGDGRIGQDVSHMTAVVKGIPAAKHFKNAEIAVRCELIMPRAKWDPSFGSNPRNVVAGVIGAKTPNMTVARLVECVAYEVIAPEGLSPSEQMSFLQTNGFKTVNNMVIGTPDIAMLSDILVRRRQESPYVIDGIVVANDRHYDRNRSGNPKYAFAFKSLLTQDRAEVIVTRVDWNISKDLYAKPLVHFNEVELAGVNIKQATGFNAAYIRANAIGPGSKITVIRAGDVIPHILEVLTPSISGEPSMPEFEYEWNDTHIDIRVNRAGLSQNSELADEIAIKGLVHFFTKIEAAGVSEGTLTRIYEAGFKTVRAVTEITKPQLLQVRGIKEKSADNIVAALSVALAALTPLKLMVASNAFGRGFGERKLALILEHCPQILESKTVPTVEELVAIPGIEAKTATAFRQTLPVFWEFVKSGRFEYVFSKKAVPVSAPKSLSSKFEDKTFVFTGFRDKDLEAIIESEGGRIASSVSKKTSYLVVKDQESESGSKATKAREAGVQIITKDQLQTMLGLGLGLGLGL